MTNHYKIIVLNDTGHKDIKDGINEFAEKNNLELIISIPKKQRLPEGLFKTRSTKQLVFQSHIPVMCMNELRVKKRKGGKEEYI